VCRDIWGGYGLLIVFDFFVRNWEKMLFDLCSRETIEKLSRKHHFRLEKKLGQNFILNSDICKKMADRCICETAHTGVIEVGPGFGALTYELAKVAGKVVAIEKDGRFAPILEETLHNFTNIKIINGDVLCMDLKELISKEFSEYEQIIMCSNLPYYITSQFIMKVFEDDARAGRMVLMIQKEVADRICASPGHKKCGVISYAVRCYANPKILFDVPKDNFFPAPKVNSSVIEINTVENKSLRSAERVNFLKVVNAGFCQRRKKLINSLCFALRLPKKYIEDALEKISISKMVRAEELSFEDFVLLSKFINS
jgi:16S rRNA (adenine1518-N6/adenine1519-N6)-dimethyltransferase